MESVLLKNKQLSTNWIFAKIKDIMDLINGKSFKRNEWESEGLPIVRIQNLNNLNATFNYTKRNHDKKYFIDNGCLLFAWSGTPGTSFGAHIWSRGPAWLNQHIYKIRFNEEQISKKYLRFAINRNLHEYINNAHGAAGLAHITKGRFENSFIPLAPLKEQHRIVAKIEELFSELDKGVEQLKAVRQQLKVYRQAVLKWAFEGKLTKAWREKNNPEPAENLLKKIKAEREKRYQEQFEEWKAKVKAWEVNGKVGGKPGKPKKYNINNPLQKNELKNLPNLPYIWNWVSLGNIFSSSPQNGIYKSSSSYGGGVKIVRIDDFYDGKFVKKKSFKLIRLSNEEIKKFKIFENNILINRVNSMPFLGKCGLVQNLSEDTVFESNIMKIEIYKRFLIPKYITYYLSCRIGLQQLRKNAKQAVNQASINQTDVSMAAFPICSTEEQHQIVQEIEARLSICDKLEQTIEESLQKAEALRQSILKKAFEGKLVPQDPSDEPAEALLQRIKAEKAMLEKEKKRKKSPAIRQKRKKQS